MNRRVAEKVMSTPWVGPGVNVLQTPPCLKRHPGVPLVSHISIDSFKSSHCKLVVLFSQSGYTHEQRFSGQSSSLL
jgi:hypothetical protein